MSAGGGAGIDVATGYPIWFPRRAFSAQRRRLAAVSRRRRATQCDALTTTTRAAIRKLDLQLMEGRHREYWVPVLEADSIGLPKEAETEHQGNRRPQKAPFGLTGLASVRQPLLPLIESSIR